MTDIAPHLERLGLEQYLNVFASEGFDTWETLTDIQESDFDALNVKLGHRRKLQRAIAEYRGISYERLLGSPAQEGPPESGRAPESSAAPVTGTERGSGPTPEAKRKYRRHPKPDENAPERPPSAYVIFSNKVREEVKDQNLSFTQIAKLVGDRWQKLDPAEKEPFEAQANAAKERYNIQLSTYRKTDAYKEYMQYLSDFKSKHGQTSEPKRPKLDAESSGSIISAKSLETNLETSQISGHVRGSSIGSVASSSLTGTSAHASTPVPSVPSRPPLPQSRSGSPPPLHQGRDYFRPGLISSHSSVSDESNPVRSDVPDPLMRTAALSLGTSSSGTPPLPPLGPMASPMDSMGSHVGSPDHLARSRLAYFVQQQQQPDQLPSATGTPSISSGQMSSIMPLPPTLPAPNMQELAWRNRPSDVRAFQEVPRALHPLPYPTTGARQPSPSQLPPLSPPDRPPDYSQGPSMRTLPPPRPPSTGAPSLSHLGSPLTTNESIYFRRPAQDQAGRPTLDRSESDAASTLAGLAAGASRPETAKHPPYPPPRPGGS